MKRDGEAFRPDGKQARTLLPPAFGLAGVNLSTWTGFGSVTYWNDPPPLAGLWTHQKGGFYHDDRFATLRDVVDHYDRFFKLGLTELQKLELGEYLKSL